MKQVVYSLFLAWFFIPFFLFAAPSPDPSIPILEFCQEEHQILKSFSIQISGLSSLIEKYESDMARQKESALTVLRQIAGYQLPDRSQILDWQNKLSPYLNESTIHQAKFRCAYELGKLRSIQEQLPSFANRTSSFWRHIDEIDRLTQGLLHQIQIVRIEQENLQSLLNHLAEQAYDSMIRHEVYGESWIAMKTDMKQTYHVLSHIRSLSPANRHQIHKEFLTLRQTVGQHLLPSIDIAHWPTQQSSHYVAFYQLICFDIIPRIDQILTAYDEKHQVFFRHQFEADMQSLSDYFTESQSHLQQMARLQQQPIVSSLQDSPATTKSKTPR